MKTNRTLLLGALIALGTLAVQTQAGAPSLMTYQGRLKESGLPVTGTRSVSIFLCPCLSGACVPACTDTGGQSVSVANGLFRTTFTVPSSMDLTTGQWYIEVQVGAIALAPREQITSSPYAIYASSAGTLVATTGTTGVFISTNLFIVGASNVGIGTTAPSARLHVISAAGVVPLIIEANTAAERFRITPGGRIEVSGPTPTLGVCTGGVFVAPSTDVVGKINFAAAGAATCAVNFTAPAWLNPPVCVASLNGAVAVGVSATATDVTFTHSATFAAGNTISYQCIGTR